MEPFFTADKRFPKISIALEDILPEEMTSASVKERTVFDKLFVPNENIVIYDTQSGVFHVTDLYEKCLSYLALSGRNIALASRAEKDLC